jgi:hypothetical protein
MKVTGYTRRGWKFSLVVGLFFKTEWNVGRIYVNSGGFWSNSVEFYNL